jgi:hypothetical protein
LLNLNIEEALTPVGGCCAMGKKIDTEKMEEEGYQEDGM